MRPRWATRGVGLGEGQMGKLIWVREPFGSDWITNKESQYGSEMMVIRKFAHPRGPQHRPELSTDFASSPKLIMIKKALHLSDWPVLPRFMRSHSRQPSLSLDSCGCWQAWDQRAVILFSLQQNYKIYSQFIMMLKYFCPFFFFFFFLSFFFFYISY